MRWPAPTGPKIDELEPLDAQRVRRRLDAATSTDLLFPLAATPAGNARAVALASTDSLRRHAGGQLRPGPAHGGKSAVRNLGLRVSTLTAIDPVLLAARRPRVNRKAGDGTWDPRQAAALPNALPLDDTALLLTAARYDLHGGILQRSRPLTRAAIRLVRTGLLHKRAGTLCPGSRVPLVAITDIVDRVLS